jgi:hypothetical protein
MAKCAGQRAQGEGHRAKGAGRRAQGRRRGRWGEGERARSYEDRRKLRTSSIEGG